MPFLIIHEYNWSHLIFLGTTMTKTSFWKQLANAMSTDLSVIFKAFWATVPRKFIKWLIWNWKKKKKIDFFTYMKKEIVKKSKRNCFTKFKKTEKRKSFQAIDGSHPPLTLSPNGVWRRQSRLDQSPPPTKKTKRIQVRERPSLKKSFALWPFLWHLSDDQKYYCDVNLPPAAKKN